MELPGRAQKEGKWEDFGKTHIGGSSSKLPNVGENKVFPWAAYGCSNVTAVGGRSLLLFQHMEPIQEFRE